MEVRRTGGLLLRMIAIVMAVVGLAELEVTVTVFAIFLWLVADSVDRLAQAEEDEWRRDSDPWKHFSR